MFYRISDLSSTGVAALLATCTFILLLGLSACKTTENTQAVPEQEPQEETAVTETENASELEELYWARIDSSRMSFTEADVKFMTGMIAHHAQALVMSRMAPEKGASHQIKTLASRIINAQKDEIASMQQWLRDRDQPIPKYEINGIDLSITINGEPYTMYKKMQGVLSDRQIRELSEAKGKDFNRLFLKYMIEHHSGAVHMVHNLFNTDGAAQDERAFRLASDIQVDQKTEIERMKLMLERLTESS